MSVLMYQSDYLRFHHCSPVLHQMLGCHCLTPRSILGLLCSFSGSGYLWFMTALSDSVSPEHSSTNSELRLFEWKKLERSHQRLAAPKSHRAQPVCLQLSSQACQLSSYRQQQPCVTPLNRECKIWDPCQLFWAVNNDESEFVQYVFLPFQSRLVTSFFTSSHFGNVLAWTIAEISSLELLVSAHWANSGICLEPI